MADRVAVAVRTGAPPLLLATTLVLTALNLRAAVTSVGAVLRDVQADLAMSDAVAGLLTSLPVLSFGIVGLSAAWISRRVGTESALATALVAIVVGLAVRAAAPSVGWLLATTLLAVVGIAVANVLVPVAVKRWFPGSVGAATGWYSLAITAGTAVPAAVTVPIAELAGTWRIGLAVWAVPALAALVPWLLLARVRRRGDPGPRWQETISAELWLADDLDGARPMTQTLGLTDPRLRPDGPELRTVTPAAVRRRGQAWALAVFFGLQSLEAYAAMGWLPAILQDAGVSPARAGLLLGVTMAISAPISLLLPVVAVRSPDQRPWVYALVGASAVAWTGLILAPGAAALLWSVVLGVGLGAFPLALVLLGLRASTPSGTAALSSLAQGVGYLIAAAGPVAVGALHGRSGSWTLPLSVLLLLLVPKLLAGRRAAAPGHVDG